MKREAFIYQISDFKITKSFRSCQIDNYDKQSTHKYIDNWIDRQHIRQIVCQTRYIHGQLDEQSARKKYDYYIRQVIGWIDNTQIDI